MEALELRVLEGMFVFKMKFKTYYVIYIMFHFLWKIIWSIIQCKPRLRKSVYLLHMGDSFLYDKSESRVGLFNMLQSGILEPQPPSIFH